MEKISRERGGKKCRLNFIKIGPLIKEKYPRRIFKKFFSNSRGKIKKMGAILRERGVSG